MVPWLRLTHTGAMNTTEHDRPPESEPDNGPEHGHGFDASRLRTILDTKRSGDDRMVAGVCAGTAKHLNIDPVILRVLVAAFTIIGGAGLIMYAAAWLLLPSQDAHKSIVARWFHLDENEESVRTVGLIVAAAIALTSSTSMIGGTWNGPFSWFGLLVFAGVYLFVIRPRQKETKARQHHTIEQHQMFEQHSTIEQHPSFEPGASIAAPAARAPNREPWSPKLTFVTFFASILVVGTMALIDNQQVGIDFTFATYLMATLATVGFGLVVGAWFGNGGLLIATGIVLAITLAIASVLPDAGIGSQTYRPTQAAAVASTYKLGIGELTVDLAGVDSAGLAGKRINVVNNIGETRVIVPEELNVDVRTTMTGGEIRVFERRNDGNNIKLRYRAADPNTAKTTLFVHNTFGTIEVIKK